jgi:hypothetical protein
VAEYEVTRARGDQESERIRRGIERATNHEGPWEFAHYIERYDGPRDNGRVPARTLATDWTPLIYEASGLEDAEEMHARHRLDTGMTEPFRNSRVLRRATSPWEVFGG